MTHDCAVFRCHLAGAHMREDGSGEDRNVDPILAHKQIPIPIQLCIPPQSKATSRAPRLFSRPQGPPLWLEMIQASLTIHLSDNQDCEMVCIIEWPTEH